MEKISKLVLGGKLLLLVLFVSGCGFSQQEEAWNVSYSDFVKDLADSQRLADLTVPGSHILTSYDPTGGNEDYSHFQGEAEPGWCLVADLKGPGFVSRFWTTGGKRQDRKVRFFFDGERKPRIDATIAELQKGGLPFIIPLSADEQACWYSYVPVTYAKSLKILMSWEGKGKLYYQVNYSSFPSNNVVESFPKSFSQDDNEAIMTLAAFYKDYSGREITQEESLHEATITVQPGKTVEAIELEGSGVISDVEFKVLPPSDMSPIEAEQVLRGLFVHAEWDSSGVESISLPLASFGGEIWRCPSFQSMYYGKSNGTYSCRFPMPYSRSAVFRIENRSDKAAQINIRAVSRPMNPQEKNMGYFHSVWNRTLPSDTGKPHAVLRTKGRGKYIGCVLGAMSKDNSWWLLEADEIIRTDEEAIVGWRGTGLEDYFTGGWYYKNNLLRPLHGLIFKVPYQTVQYRIHQNDAPSFDSSIEVYFERGPDNASHGLMESVAFYYLETPSVVQFPDDLKTTELSSDPLEQAVIMQTLCNYERFGDYKGASRYIDFYLDKDPTVGFASVLRLRQIAYIERTEGIQKAAPEYRSFTGSNTNAAALNYAKLIMWYHSSPKHAILSVNCSNPTQVFMDGKAIGSVSHPQIFGLFPIVLSKGDHELMLETAPRRYPEWVHACLRTHEGMVMTDQNCEFMWGAMSEGTPKGYRGSSWRRTADIIHEGPPAAPHIWMTPHPMVDMQALAKAVWVNTTPPKEGSGVLFRKRFVFSGRAD